MKVVGPCEQKIFINFEKSDFIMYVSQFYFYTFIPLVSYLYTFLNFILHYQGMTLREGARLRIRDLRW